MRRARKERPPNAEVLRTLPEKVARIAILAAGYAIGLTGAVAVRGRPCKTGLSYDLTTQIRSYPVTNLRSALSYKQGSRCDGLCHIDNCIANPTIVNLRYNLD